MSLVLYRKYRPQNLEEVIGQPHVVSAIRNALRMEKIAHAYLFSGPRGVGKTTIARLIAKAVNCTGSSPETRTDKKERPCGTCATCSEFNHGRGVDIIEIDAASNRGIDEIRELREGVRVVPTQGAYKTYIIDECHMLTKEAFNALLKTLEEPPAHAIFILATTELDKVPATIISRTQHYDFRRPKIDEIVTRLQEISQKEHIQLEQDAARLVAFAAEGSMRDAESILGQILAVSDKKVRQNDVENVLGLPRREAAKNMFTLIAQKNAPAALALVQELHNAGYDLSYFSKLLLQYFRNALFLKTDPALKQFIVDEMLPDEYDCITANLNSFELPILSKNVETILQNMQQFKKAPIPQLPLELTVLELIAK